MNMYETYNKLTEQEQIECVKKDSFSIIWIQNPSENVLVEVLKQRATEIGYINNPSELLQMTAIRTSQLAMNLIDFPTEKATQLHKMLWEI